jgi:hypothetical protein
MVQMTTLTPGNVATINLSSFISGYQSFANAGAANNASYSYGIQDVANKWEVGQGVYITNSSGAFFVRTTIQYSSNTPNNFIVLSGNAVIYSTMLQQDYDTFAPANSISVGALTINATGIYDGNSTANLFANSIEIALANASGVTTITPTTYAVGNSTANGFSNSTIEALANATAQTTFSPGILRLSGAGSNAGLIVGTSSQLANATAVFGANGYTFLPNGFLFQWIANTANTTAAQKAWPQAFPTACVSSWTSVQSTASQAVATIVSSNTTGANVISANTGNPGMNVYVFGIGF